MNADKKLEVRDIKDPRKWSISFVDNLQADPQKAFDGIRIFGLQPVGIRRLLDKVVQFEQSSGRIIRYEQLPEGTVGKSVVKTAFLLDAERGASLATMTFYYAPQKKTWFLTGMEIGDDAGRFPFVYDKR